VVYVPRKLTVRDTTVRFDGVNQLFFNKWLPGIMLRRHTVVFVHVIRHDNITVTRLNTIEDIVAKSNLRFIGMN
jgi:hypothetical protein